MSVVQGDAVRVTRELASGSVFFFYCPFSGERLERVLDDLEAIARTRPIRICAVHVTLPPRPWFAELGSDVDVTVYRSVC